MPRYIDLDKIPHLSGLLSLEDGLLVPIGELRKALEMAQVEDMVPVLHARWIGWKEEYREINGRVNGWRVGVFCSHCGYHTDNPYDHCIKCGAKMDLKGEQDEKRID